jgi:hypothetical protein
MLTSTSEVDYCLGRIGITSAGWQTLIVQGSAVTTASPERVWEVWSDLRTWPEWSPLHLQATWAGDPGFITGAQFDQMIKLGFPVGTKTQRVLADVLEPAVRASWSGDESGVRSCHTWSFTLAEEGGTLISDVEVFTGTTIGLVRPLVGRRWNAMFQRAADGLARMAEAG